MSNQCEVLSCAARNRDIGGSPESRIDRYANSNAAPARDAAAREIDFSTGGNSAKASTSSIHRQQFTGSPWLIKYAFPAGELEAVAGCSASSESAART